MSDQVVRTRFAPSPTGYLHVGGARTALFNYLYARARGGQYILRIEDTDLERSTEESYHLMIESLKWLGLTWDEGPDVGGPHQSYKQSERLPIYKEYATRLIDENHAYRCFCTTEELEIKKKKSEAMGKPPVYDGKCRNLSPAEIEKKIEENHPFTVRFKMANKEVVVHDLVQGEVRFDAGLIGDFIIVKSNHYPSYNFAVVIDDYLMNINHVIRGVGHLSNTPRQIAIYHALGWEEPKWAHVSEIVGSDHKKLSKRHGATSITAFRDLGYSRDAFINYMSLLGWSPPDGKEFMTENDIIRQFDIARCSKSPAMFDVFDLSVAGDTDLSSLDAKELSKYLFAKSKMNWLSNLHIRDTSKESYVEQVFPFIQDLSCIPDTEKSKDNPVLISILESLRVYLDYYYQIGNYICDFYGEINFEENATEFLKSGKQQNLLETFLGILKDVDPFQADNIKEAINTASKKTGVKGKDLFMTIRCASTGKMAGLELPVYIQLLGKERVIQRVEHAISLL